MFLKNPSENSLINFVSCYFVEFMKKVVSLFIMLGIKDAMGRNKDFVYF